MCKQDTKKGPCVQNIVIILSSWAVLKIPMLLNEAKFLGPQFMALRWVLTVISIIVFSWIMNKIIKEQDMPEGTVSIAEGVHVNRDACMGCRQCVRNYPDLFAMDGKKAIVLDYETLDMDKLNIFCVEDCTLLHIEKAEVEKLLHDYQFTINFLKCISLNSQTINQKLHMEEYSL